TVLPVHIDVVVSIEWFRTVKTRVQEMRLLVRVSRIMGSSGSSRRGNLVLLVLSSLRVVVFFFQAEDGIRDFHVTGVQTCALPISSPPARAGSSSRWTRPSRTGCSARPGPRRSGTVPTLPGWSTLGAACTPPVGCG